MKHILKQIVSAVCLVGISTSAYAQSFTWQNINQQDAPSTLQPKAYLKVYSEAHIYHDMDVQRLDRLPYTIYSADGKKLRFIAYNDFNPKLVTLPPGKYVIVPETRRFKEQIVGAVLTPGHLTEVHFKGENPV